MSTTVQQSEPQSATTQETSSETTTPPKPTQKTIPVNNNKSPLLVRDLMHKELISVTPETSLRDAILTLVSNRVKRLPVLDNSGKLVGIVTDRDLRLASNSPLLEHSAKQAEEALSKHKVSEIMHQGVITVDDDAPIVEAAKLMRVSSVGGLPVVNKAGDVIGIISRTDLLDQLIRMVEPLPTQDDLQS